MGYLYSIFTRIAQPFRQIILFPEHPALICGFVGDIFRSFFLKKNLQQLDHLSKALSMHRRTVRLFPKLLAIIRGFSNKPFQVVVISFFCWCSLRSCNLVLKICQQEEHQEIRHRRWDSEALAWSDYKSMRFTQCLRLSLSLSLVEPNQLIN